jgi:hypothetical protein
MWLPPFSIPDDSSAEVDVGSKRYCTLLWGDLDDGAGLGNGGFES